MLLSLPIVFASLLYILDLFLILISLLSHYIFSFEVGILETQFSRYFAASVSSALNTLYFIDNNIYWFSFVNKFNQVAKL